MEIFNALLNLKRLWHKCTVQALDKRKAIFFLLLILPAILNAGKDTVSSQDLVNIEVTRGGNGIFRVVFFSGVRFADGLGDLTLNKYLIQQQIKLLQKRYGNRIEVHIVFLNEPKGDHSTPFKEREAVKVLYTEPVFSTALKALDANKGKTIFNIKENLYFWSEKQFHKFIELNPGQMDLGFMASEASRTVPQDSRYHLPTWIGENMNVIRLLEYSYGNEDYRRTYRNGMTVMEWQSESQFTPKTIDASVETGPEAQGIIFDLQNEVLDKSELLQLIKKDLIYEQGRFTVFNWGAAPDVNGIMNTDPYFVVSRTNRIDDLLKPKLTASVPLLMAFYHWLELGHKSDRGYVVFTNGEAFNAREAEEALLISLSKSFKNLHEGQVESLKKQWRVFIGQKALFLHPGKKSLSTKELRSFFSPKNDALFVEIGGFGTLTDAFSVGMFPLIVERDYHSEFVGRLSEKVSEIGEKVEPGSGVLVQEFMNLAASVSCYSDLVRLINLKNQLNKVFGTIVKTLKKEINLNTFVGSAIEIFRKAKDLDPNSPRKGLTQLIRQTPQLKNNNFLKELLRDSWASEVRMPLLPIECKAIF